MDLKTMMSFTVATIVIVIALLLLMSAASNSTKKCSVQIKGGEGIFSSFPLTPKVPLEPNYSAAVDGINNRVAGEHFTTLAREYICSVKEGRKQKLLYQAQQ